MMKSGSCLRRKDHDSGPSTGIRTWNVGWTCTTSISQSFAIQRIRDKMGSSDHRAIRFTDTPLASGNDLIRPLRAGRSRFDEWMPTFAAIRQRPLPTIVPSRAVDSCFDVNGALIAKAQAWDGVLDRMGNRARTKVVSMYSTARIVAGAPLEGGIFGARQVGGCSDSGWDVWQFYPDAGRDPKLSAIFPEGSVTTANRISQSGVRNVIADGFLIPNRSAERNPKSDAALCGVVGRGHWCSPIQRHPRELVELKVSLRKTPPALGCAQLPVPALCIALQPRYNSPWGQLADQATSVALCSDP